jgi:hypothetical protein
MAGNNAAHEQDPAKHYLVARVLLMSDQSQGEPEATEGQIAEILSMFYEVFPPEQAKALADRLEIPYTPKHASWLNIAEIELSVLARQGLAHNIATIEDLCHQVQSRQNHRNQQVGTVNWQ